MSTLNRLTALLALAVVVTTSPTPSKPLNMCELNELDYRPFMFCSCDNYDKPTDVACFATTSNSSAEDSLWDGFNGARGITLFKLSSLSGNRFTYFPYRILAYFRESLIKLIISDVQLDRLATGAIQNLELLEDIIIQLCESLTIERDAFQSLPKLKRVSVEDGNLGTLVDIFQDVPAIEEVFLEKNRITDIEPGAFQALGHLHYLGLDKNVISSISREMFVGLKSLHNLHLNWNKLKVLPANVFTEMPHLTEIELISNEIEEIDVNAFSGLPNLQSIKLERNRLKAFPAGGLFATNYQLVVVDLAFNEFDYLSWQVFYQREKGRYIRMRIKGNAIKCTCSIYWMSEALKYYDSIVEQELQTMDCVYEGGGNSRSKLQFEPAAGRPKTIYDFITSPAVGKQCKLPSALVKQEAGAGPLVDGEEVEVDDDDEEDLEVENNNSLPKLPEGISEGAGIEKGEQNGQVNSNNNQIVDSIQPAESKTTHVYESGVVPPQVNAEENNKKSPELSHASFGQSGSSSAQHSANLLCTILLLLASFIASILV